MSGNLKLSVVARFDDLYRFAALLTESSDIEFREFVLSQEECRKHWLQTELDLHRSTNLNLKLQAENKDLQMNLEYCRKVYSQEINKRRIAEQEKKTLERQLKLIKEIILDANVVNDQTREKLAFLNEENPRTKKFESPLQLGVIDESGGSIFSPSDIDLTEEELDAPNVRSRLCRPDGKKRSSIALLPDDIQPKKPKLDFKEKSTAEDGDISGCASTTFTVTSSKSVIVTSKTETTEGNLKVNRSHSEPGPSTQSETTPLRVPIKSEGDESFIQIIQSLQDVRDIPFARYALNKPRLSLGKITTRPHDFVAKTFIKPEKCITCNKKINFGRLALRCKECKTVCHEHCKEKIPIFCIPTNVTPGYKGLEGCVIGDFVSNSPPRIPALLVHCVTEVELRGLNQVGLYRISGSDKDIKDLKEKFLRGKRYPKLSDVDVNVVCGCIKAFLRSLKEPIVTRNLWHEFVQAAELQNDVNGIERIENVIVKLPLANRDTLACIILHLQMVAKSADCKMPASNLAKVFGPTIVGYSSDDVEPATMLAETKQQARVIERLMQLSKDYWTAFIHVSIEPDSVFTTPDRCPVADRVLSTPLMPRSSAVTRGRNILGHSPLGPRDGVKTVSYGRPQKFFASPTLN